MLNFIGWDEIGNDGKQNGSSEYLRVKPGCNYKVRLIGNLARIVKIFTNDRRCIILDSEDTGKMLMKKYPDKFHDVSIRYICWCIDRNSIQ